MHNHSAPAAPEEAAPTPEAALLPCPFCGSTKILRGNFGEFCWWFRCDDCRTDGPSASITDDQDEPLIAKQEAIAAWNRRVGEGSPRSELPEAEWREPTSGYHELWRGGDLLGVLGWDRSRGVWSFRSGHVSMEPVHLVAYERENVVGARDFAARLIGKPSFRGLAEGARPETDNALVRRVAAAIAKQDGCTEDFVLTRHEAYAKAAIRELGVDGGSPSPTPSAASVAIPTTPAESTTPIAIRGYWATQSMDGRWHVDRNYEGPEREYEPVANANSEADARLIAAALNAHAASGSPSLPLAVPTTPESSTTTTLSDDDVSALDDLRTCGGFDNVNIKGGAPLSYCSSCGMYEASGHHEGCVHALLLRVSALLALSPTGTTLPDEAVAAEIRVEMRDDIPESDWSPRALREHRFAADAAVAIVRRAEARVRASSGNSSSGTSDTDRKGATP
jgi:Lar family restriction alleviation protein